MSTTRVPFSEPPTTRRHEPSALCRSLSDEFCAPGASKTELSVYSIKESGDEVLNNNRTCICAGAGGLCGAGKTPSGQRGRFGIKVGPPNAVESRTALHHIRASEQIKSRPGPQGCCRELRRW